MMPPVLVFWTQRFVLRFPALFVEGTSCTVKTYLMKEHCQLLITKCLAACSCVADSTAMAVLSCVQGSGLLAEPALQKKANPRALIPKPKPESPNT